MIRSRRGSGTNTGTSCSEISHEWPAPEGQVKQRARTPPPLPAHRRRHLIRGAEHATHGRRRARPDTDTTVRSSLGDRADGPRPAPAASVWAITACPLGRAVPEQPRHGAPPWAANAPDARPPASRRTGPPTSPWSPAPRPARSACTRRSSPGSCRISPGVSRSAHASASAWDGMNPDSTVVGQPARPGRQLARWRRHTATHRAIAACSGRRRVGHERGQQIARLVRRAPQRLLERRPVGPCAAEAHAASSSHTPSAEDTDPSRCWSSTEADTRRAYAPTSDAVRPTEPPV